MGEGRGLAVPGLRRGSLDEEGQQVVLQHRGCGGRPLAVGWEEKRGGSAGGKPGEGKRPQGICTRTESVCGESEHCRKYKTSTEQKKDNQNDVRQP